MSERFCIECGAELPEAAKFCSECGTDVADSTQREGAGTSEAEDGEDAEKLEPSRHIGNCPICGAPPGRGSILLNDITCPECGSHWESTPYGNLELVESEAAPELVGNAHSRDVWKRMEPGENIEEIIDSAQAKFDSRWGRLPGVSSENSSEKNTGLGMVYGLVVVILLFGIIVTAADTTESDSFENCSTVAAHTEYYQQSSDFEVETGEYVHVSVENRAGFRTAVAIEDPAGDTVLSEGVEDSAVWTLGDESSGLGEADAGWWTVRSTPHDESRETSGEVIVRTCPAGG